MKIPASMQSIGARMKSYEENQRLEKGAVIIRVDGKGFHTWTKKIGALKPFDSVVHDCMVHATKRVSMEMQGCRIAYTQSDETTFLLTNLGEKEGAWFDYKVQKLASVTASMFTHYFNARYEYAAITRGYPSIPAFFDARAFSIPVEDAANVFVWRQQDWNRNSVQMLGHHHMGHAKMQNRTAGVVRTILKDEYGVDWFGLMAWEKFGTFVYPHPEDPLNTSIPLDYYEINRVAGLDKYLEKMNDSYSNGR
jgi:tRNA(His) guanylyltransferase